MMTANLALVAASGQPVLPAPEVLLYSASLKLD